MKYKLISILLLFFLIPFISFADNQVQYFDDFLTSNLNNYYTLRSANSTVSFTLGSSNSYLNLNVGPNFLNNIFIFLGADDLVNEIRPFNISQNLIFETKLYLLNKTSNTRLRFGFSGFGNMINATEQIVFAYDKGTNSDNIFLIVNNNTSSTVYNTDLDPTIERKYRIETSSNLIEFYADDNLIYSQVSDLPSRNMYSGLGLLSGSATTGNTLFVDFYNLVYDKDYYSLSTSSSTSTVDMTNLEYLTLPSIFIIFLLIVFIILFIFNFNNPWRK